jgi:hypothetical protein
MILMDDVSCVGQDLDAGAGCMLPCPDIYLIGMLYDDERSIAAKLSLPRVQLIECAF